MSHLHAGFKGGTCPITHERTLNAIRDFKGYHLSYNPSSADYGTDTTAIVLKGRVFLVLNGDHRQALSDAADAEGLQGCIDYFIANIGQANAKSEHYMVVGARDDVFELLPTAIEVIGQANIRRITYSTPRLA